jgi:lipid II:glycine glycyltransferase (peptidoglycan interpeptide bridge formation enzyme)
MNPVLHNGLFSVKRITSYRLKLNRSYEDVFRSLSKDRQKNIRKANKHGLSVKKTNNIEDVIALFKLNTAHKIYGGVKEHQYQKLRELQQATERNKMSEVILVINNKGKVVCGTFNIIFKELIIKYFNASNEEGRKLNADSYLMDYLIKEYSGKNYTIDFERDSTPGVNDYKESFNPEKLNYISISYNSYPKVLNILNRIRQKLILRFK